MCTAKIERQDGRKVYVHATIEDGSGMVYSIGKGLFIEVRSKL
jgi:thioesterase superfamily protein 4